MSSEIKDYDENIETLFIRFMISNADLFVRCRGILKADFFDNKTNRSVIELIMSHSEQYNAIPSLEQILAVTGKSFELLGDVAYKEDNWFLKEIEYFCKYKGLRDAILSSPELLDEGRYGEVEALIKSAVQIGLVKDLGLDYFADPKARLESIKNSNGQIKTGWKDVDDKLYGGLNRGEITIFAGQCVVSSTKVLATRSLDIHPHYVDIIDLTTANRDWYVDSPDGLVLVDKLVDKGKHEILEVTFTDGTTIRTSPFHMFERSDGEWLSTINLFPGNTIVSTNGVKEVLGISDIHVVDNVYDLVIDSNEHRYYTNGLSSHNSGAGKSLFLQNLAVNWVLAGLNIVYITLELSEKLCSLRIDAMFTGFETREVMRNIDDASLKISTIHKKHKGELRVKQMPNGCTATDLRAYIKEYEIQSKRKVDGILVDYLDLMMPQSKKISAENLFVKDKYVTEELRNLAVELNVLMSTASQLNRCLAPDTKVTIDGKGEIEIKDVEIGDYIQSDNGYNRIIDKWDSSQPVYKIRLKSGKEIVCSANHKFPTRNGEKTIETGLGVGEVLYVKK